MRLNGGHSCNAPCKKRPVQATSLAVIHLVYHTGSCGRVGSHAVVSVAIFPVDEQYQCTG